MDINEKAHPSSVGLGGMEIRPNLQKLQSYRQAKLALADQLRAAKEAFNALGREEAGQQMDDLMTKLAEDHFTLAVLGQFKRGKSSLMNAIIGKDLLPTGLLPLTSAITALQYGPAEHLLITRENSTFTEDFPVSALPEYVTEKGNPENCKRVKKATLELPVPFLRQGLEFVDTPGIGSSIAANTAVTYSFLPECDAVILVTSVDTPMSAAEIEFLKEIRSFVNKIFLVVNKIDLVADNEKEEILAFVSRTIRNQVGNNIAGVYPVSARMGLSARISGNKEFYERSGLKAFEETLAAFLSEEKSSAFLLSMVQKALRIIEDEDARGAFQEDALQTREEEMQKPDFVMFKRDPHESATAVQGTKGKLETLAREISSGRLGKPTGESAPPATGAKMKAAAKIRIFTASFQSADLSVRGCPICRRVTKNISDFFAQWQYAIGSDETAQSEFTAELGFCPLHTWQLLAMCSPHGASVGFSRLTERIARKISVDSVKSASGDAVRELVRSSQNCRVCGLVRDWEQDSVHELADLLIKDDFRSQYYGSQGVCLRHLAMLLDAVGSDDIRSFLLTVASERFEEDSEDMRSFALKQESRRRALENRNEEDAYRRAVIRLVGERSLCVPWREDGEI